MNQIYFPFSSIFEESFFSSVANVLGSEISEDLITVPDTNGHGSVLFKTIDEGLLFLSCDIKLDKNMEIEKVQTREYKNRGFFLINYILKADNINIEGKGIPKGFAFKPGRSIFLMVDNASLKISIPAGEIFRSIHIGIDIKWLKKELNRTDLSVTNFIKMLERSQVPDFFLGFGKASETKTLFELNRNLSENSSNILFIKGRILSLVSDFFSTLFSKTFKVSTVIKNNPIERITEVELLLKDHLGNKFPGMEFIAKEMSMSVSTLKRHFKTMHGVGIHEHYLALKMEYAKQLLLEDSLTVGEVADRLAYEKVSSFIETFKKHHGSSPGMLRKTADKINLVIGD